MTTAIITQTNAGSAIGAAAATAGAPGLAWGIYDAVSTENDDWIILPEFKEVIFVIAKKIAAGVLTNEPVTMDVTTKNKIVFTGGGSDTMRVLVFGKPSII